MANINLKADDVLLAQGKPPTPADSTEHVKLPAYVSDGGRGRTVRFDVGADGKAELSKIKATVEKRLADAQARYEAEQRAAWKPMLDLIAKRDAAIADLSGGSRRGGSAAGDAQEQPPAPPAPPRPDQESLDA